MFDSNGIRVLPSLNVIQYRDIEGTVGAISIAEVKCSKAKKDVCSFQYKNGESEATVWPGM